MWTSSFSGVSFRVFIFGSSFSCFRFRVFVFASSFSGLSFRVYAFGSWVLVCWDHVAMSKASHALLLLERWWVLSSKLTVLFYFSDIADTLCSFIQYHQVFLIIWKPLRFASWFPTLISCSLNLPRVRLCKHGNHFTFLQPQSRWLVVDMQSRRDNSH